jgi:CMP-N-acetylneuraminic acid synthetase
MNNAKRTVAVVPAKANSTRVPEKNFREFADGKSLVEIKIEQLLAAEIYDEIYLSSDHPSAQSIAEKYGVRHIVREPYLAAESTPWHETLVGILVSTGEAPQDVDVSWVQVTNPLFSDFRRVIEALDSAGSKHDSAFTTTVFKHYLLAPNGSPLNFQFGPWHKYSPDLEPYRTVNFAMLHAPLHVMMDHKYFIGSRPITVDISLSEGWDIDTVEEFEIAQSLFCC